MATLEVCKTKALVDNLYYIIMKKLYLYLLLYYSEAIDSAPPSDEQCKKIRGMGLIPDEIKTTYGTKMKYFKYEPIFIKPINLSWG